MTTQKILVATIAEQNMQLANAVIAKVEGNDRTGVVFTVQYVAALERNLRQIQPSLVSLSKLQAANAIAAQLGIEAGEWQGEDSFLNVPVAQPEVVEPSEVIEPAPEQV